MSEKNGEKTQLYPAVFHQRVIVKKAIFSEVELEKVVSVEKKQESKEEDKSAKYLRREFNYTRFEQALLLPDNVDKEAISAKACSGVLCITLPKLAAEPDKQPTRVIDIQ